MKDRKSKLIAKFLGTFWLFFGGCCGAVLAAKFLTNDGTTPINLGIGLVGVAFAFGLTVLTMACAIGHTSGCHLNPAVSIGLFVGKRFRGTELPPYFLAQVFGAVAGAGLLAVVAGGQADFSMAGPVRGRLGLAATLDVLVGTDPWRCTGGSRLSFGRRWSGRGGQVTAVACG